MATVSLTKLIFQWVGVCVFFALILFLPAGTLRWPAAWTLLVLFLGSMIALGGWLLKHNPALLAERMAGGVGRANQPLWDKIFFIALNVFFIVWFVVMALDVVRFGWSHMPVWVQPPGAILLLFSFYLFFLTFRENSYLSPAVRVQPERGQTVISTGPYHYVRHPMYAASFVLFAGIALLLGSLYGLVTALIFVFGFAFRARREEQVLRAQLPGYADYMAQVKYRFIPYVW